MRSRPVMVLALLLIGVTIIGVVLVVQMLDRFGHDRVMVELPSYPPVRIPRPVLEATFYVDAVSGSDDADGRSPQTAWRSLQRASDADLPAGSGLLLRRGQTHRGTLVIAERRVVVGAYGDGALPVITDGTVGVRLDGDDNIVRDVHVDSATWAGIEIRGDRNLVTGAVATGSACGIEIDRGADANGIIANRIAENSRMSVNTPGGQDDSGAFGILLHGDDTEVAFNVITGQRAASYDYDMDGGAIEVYGAQRSHVHHNIAMDNDGFVELGHHRSRDNVFSENIVYSTAVDDVGLVTRGAGSRWGPIEGTRFSDNVVILTGEGSQGFVCHGGCTSDLLSLQGNVIVAAWKVGFADGPVAQRENIYWGGKREFSVHPSSRIAEPVLAPDGILLTEVIGDIDPGQLLQNDGDPIRLRMRPGGAPDA